jgi:hypothetical protein
MRACSAHQLFDFHSMIGDQHRDRAANRRSGIGIEFHNVPHAFEIKLGHLQRPCKAVVTRERTMSRFASRGHILAGGIAAASFRPGRRHLVHLAARTQARFDRHVCFRKDRIVGDSALIEFLTMEPALCPTR